MKIRLLKPHEIPAALELAKRVFMLFEAPDYGEEGVRAFTDSLADHRFISGLVFYGAFEKGELLGTIATRRNGSHISYLFVDERYHRRGIGRRLVEKVLKSTDSPVVTVNAAPYPVGFYHRLGFCDTDTEQVQSGIRYTPMRLEKNQIKEKI